MLAKHEIGTLIFIGGLPALEAAKFAVEAAKTAGYELSVLVVPVSPENEVSAGDHCPGYGSAARAAALATRDAARGALGGEEPIVVLEFGGAGAGWLAAATALARDEFNAAPHAILLPERQVDLDEMVEEMRRAHQKYGYIVVVTTDAARDKDGNALDAANLTEQLSAKLNLPARYDRLGLTTSVSGADIAIGDANEAYGLGGLIVRRVRRFLLYRPFAVARWRLVFFDDSSDVHVKKVLAFIDANMSHCLEPHDISRFREQRSPSFRATKPPKSSSRANANVSDRLLQNRRRLPRMELGRWPEF